MFGIRGISPLFWALRLHREEGADPQRFFPPNTTMGVDQLYQNEVFIRQRSCEQFVLL